MATDFEAVGVFLNRVDAELARGALEAADIPATVSADDAAGTRPHLWMSGVRVLVRTEDLERAREVLREAEQHARLSVVPDEHEPD
ncbi:MAG TPA: DUF2007 domain-containing protein [Vicinamibacterales bacterium]|nr:DUF2007 domain-containing protein [Vicinamibacterales bacterium]